MVPVPVSKTSCPRAGGLSLAVPSLPRIHTSAPSPAPHAPDDCGLLFLNRVVGALCPPFHLHGRFALTLPNATPSGGEGGLSVAPHSEPPTPSAPPWHSTPRTKVKLGRPSNTPGEGASSSGAPAFMGPGCPSAHPSAPAPHACGFPRAYRAEPLLSLLRLPSAGPTSSAGPSHPTTALGGLSSAKPSTQSRGVGQWAPGGHPLWTPALDVDPVSSRACGRAPMTEGLKHATEAQKEKCWALNKGGSTWGVWGLGRGFPWRAQLSKEVTDSRGGRTRDVGSGIRSWCLSFGGREP